MAKERIKQGIRRAVRFVANPRLLMCVGVAWVITNGWSYVMFALGTAWQVDWMMTVSGAYLTFLWLPISPEKLLTVAIAMTLLRWWFPQDRQTLAVLKTSYAKTKDAVKRRRECRKQSKIFKGSDR